MAYEQLKKYVVELSQILTAPPIGDFHHPCIVVSKNSAYTLQLWDWGNWVNNIALRQIYLHQGKQEELFAYEKGSVLNFLDQQRPDGRAAYGSYPTTSCTRGFCATAMLQKARSWRKRHWTCWLRMLPKTVPSTNTTIRKPAKVSGTRASPAGTCWL